MKKNIYGLVGSFFLVSGLMGCSDDTDYSSLSNSSSYESEYDTLNLDVEVVNFSGKSDGTYVNGIGTIQNNSSEYVDEISELVFLDENDQMIRIKYITIELAPGESMFFEELVGLVSEGTPVPKSVMLQL